LLSEGWFLTAESLGMVMGKGFDKTLPGPKNPFMAQMKSGFRRSISVL
jgi:hypothetical protein